ncbi:MAG TPA: ATP-binding protein, partial [Polyangia bacterium]|nr:ATP-binding protein [Polyangia bacterium]
RMAVVDGDLRTIALQRWPRIRTAHRALDLMNENSRIALRLFLERDYDEAGRLIAQQERNREAINGLMAEIEGSQDSAEGRRLFEEVKVARARYVDAFTRARSLLRQSRFEEGRVALAEVAPRLNELRRTWDALFAHESALMNEAAAVSALNYRAARHSVILVSIGSALFAALMALGITGKLDGTFRALDRARREAEVANRTLTDQMQVRAKMEIELRQAQKLQSVGRLAAGVAHEINTPVQYASDSMVFLESAVAQLTAAVERYRREAPEATGRAETGSALDHVMANASQAVASALEGLDRVAAIVRSLVEFARPVEAEMTPVDLNQAITSTLAIARSEYKLHADVETELGELPRVTCQASDINQVILAVVINAAHAIADAAGPSGKRGRIRIKTWQEGELVALSIADTGGGIPRPIREQIFDPFFTTKEVGRGTGQGLTIARAVIVERHGGTITFETEVGHGTTFFIRLPIRPASVEAA